MVRAGRERPDRSRRPRADSDCELRVPRAGLTGYEAVGHGRSSRSTSLSAGLTVYNDFVFEVPAGAGWSPTDNPYAIAVSEATWWRCAVQLAVGRLDDVVDSRAAPVSSTQIDARNLVFALVQLLAAEALEQHALRDLEIDSAVIDALSEARDRYLRALPGIQHMRNALTHFEEWSLGQGRQPQKVHVAAGSEPRDVAAHFWGFGYDQAAREIRLGPFTLELARVVPAALDLYRAIDAAAREVYRRGLSTPPSC